jgi:aminomethyltransferase
LIDTTAGSTLRETPLTGLHRELGARMVPFAGYSMPVQYPTGIIAEHKWTREHAGLFDVSHMGPAFLTLTERSGDPDADHDAVAAIAERLTPGDIRGLRPGQIRYTVLLNQEGGVLDDLMIARPPDLASAGSLYIVVNAATKEEDFALIEVAAGAGALLQRNDDHGLIALQGPEAAAVMATLVPAAADLGFMRYGSFAFLVSRSGSTGEDGFEILAPPDDAAALWRRLTADERVRPAGLGARDSLRLEAGLPLYGHELDETISPIEAGLAFAVSKRRRETADFPGAERILGELADEPARVRVGLLVEGAPARDGAEILDQRDEVVGHVTSGGFSPTLGRPIAMGYVPPVFSAAGTGLVVKVRGRAQPATVTPLPFVPHRYVRKSAS